MARSRNIKPGFFTDDQLAECHPLGRILFEGLWVLADREGRLEDRPKKIKIEILPYDDCDIDQLLNELASKFDSDGNSSFIIRYEINLKRYIQIVNFLKHQHPHVKEVASTIPAPDKNSSCIVLNELKEESNIEHQEENSTVDEPSKTAIPGLHGASTVQVPDKNSSIRADSLNPITDSLNIDSLNDENNERTILNLLKGIEGYQFDYEKDLAFIRTLAVDFPKADLTEKIKEWKTWLLDHPLKKNANPRLQIRNWVKPKNWGGNNNGAHKHSDQQIQNTSKYTPDGYGSYFK